MRKSIRRAFGDAELNREYVCMCNFCYGTSHTREVETRKHETEAEIETKHVVCTLNSKSEAKLEIAFLSALLGSPETLL